MFDVYFCVSLAAMYSFFFSSVHSLPKNLQLLYMWCVLYTVLWLNRFSCTKYFVAFIFASCYPYFSVFPSYQSRNMHNYIRVTCFKSGTVTYRHEDWKSVPNEIFWNCHRNERIYRCIMATFFSAWKAIEFEYIDGILKNIAAIRFFPFK